MKQGFLLPKRISLMAAFCMLGFISSFAQSLDQSFDPGAGFSSGFATGIDCEVYTIAQQPDGKYIAGGIFTSYDGTPANSIVRINNDGSVDASFKTGTGFTTASGHARIYDVVVQPDGKILVSGYFEAYNGTTCYRLVRLNADGSMDAAFQGVNAPSYDQIVLQPDGKIINSTVRLNTDGSIDLTYNGATANKDMTLRSDGKIIGPLFRLNADGTKDPTFKVPGSGFNDVVEHVLLQPDGKTVVSGYFVSFNGVSRRKIARMNVDGSLDAGFEMVSSAPWVNTPLAIALQPDGKILVSSPASVYRLQPNGQFDNPFGNIGTDGDVLDMLVQQDGKIMMVGKFTQQGLISRNCIVRINGDKGTGISTVSKEGISIYPNPSTGAVQVCLDSEGTVTVADMTGHVLQSRTWPAGTHTLALNYPKGSYTISIATGTHTYSETILLQ